MNEEFWKQFPPIPGFDCVKMKHEAQAKLHERIKDLSPEELVEYFAQPRQLRLDDDDEQLRRAS